jgi:hypothetical protein
MQIRKFLSPVDYDLDKVSKVKYHDINLFISLYVYIIYIRNINSVESS